ncbi:MAG: aryl-sulfate sulfotransferase [Candidatus Electryonea clarkiae]|nr:aryl-sulfate sulfotransferase [Candidatus Electryonea clarkiae]MDP8288339.1 aryl-sulfate sulfotransferase [Candidatus Electryonea clarkiae]
MQHDRKNYFISTIVITIIAMNISAIAQEAYEGYTLFNPNGARATYLINMDGETVHTWNNNRSGGYSVYLLENGHILRPAEVSDNQLRGGAFSGLVQEIDQDGNLIWEFEYNSATYLTHHDIEPMPNGNVLLIAWEVKSAAEARTAGREQVAIMWPDHIIEIEPDGNGDADIIWEWHAWDHLIQNYDQQRDNYGTVADHPELIDVNVGSHGGPGPGGGGGDWLHINGISYNPDLDQIVISSHFADEIYVIDHSTTTEEAASHEGGDSGMGGDILFRWGMPENYDAPDDQYFDVVHCSWWIPEGLPGEGNILIFNNGEGDRASEIVELTPPMNENGEYILEPGEAYGPTEPAWSYSDGTDFYSRHLGGCQRLPNGNTLISESTSGYLFEVDSEDNTVWDYQYGSEVARSLRYGLDYPGIYALFPVEEGDLVINEILVENDTTESDQDGEFDGWIELYNNSDADYSLRNFYLSDDTTNLTKWAFPDTTISAQDYLIIWTDEDVEQAGLHTNFELTGSGETLVFIAPDFAIIDDITLNDQAVDSSIGRYPNGTGDFTGMIPSFSAENTVDNSGISNTDDIPDQFGLMQSYPNPFNPTTTISFKLDQSSEIRLSIHNVLGEYVTTLIAGKQSKGQHQVVWDATNESGQMVSSGIYFSVLKGENISGIHKLVFMR